MVREGDAVVVIEGTALYAFDVLREPGLQKYRAKVTGDLAKAGGPRRMPTHTRWCSAHTSSEKSLRS